MHLDHNPIQQRDEHEKFGPDPKTLVPTVVVGIDGRALHLLLTKWNKLYYMLLPLDLRQRIQLLDGAHEGY
jgi:hypothetical protein